MQTSPIASLSGYRRRIRIVPKTGQVTAALEDDVHCMAVTLQHESGRIFAVEAQMQRRPWNTCSGAIGVVEAAFVGMLLDEATARGGKRQNCTHLYDLAELAAAHALDHGPMQYDVLVSDPQDGQLKAELYRDGERLLDWDLRDDDTVLAPAELAGVAVHNLRERIGHLTGAEREAARLLQWASLVAHCRTFPIEEQTDTSWMPPNCYSFQPERAALAKHIGVRIDFSAGGREPLSHFDGTRLSDDPPAG